MKSININKENNTERGVAGIEILIEIVIGLFILGILVFCITLMGSEISDQDSIYKTTSIGFVNQSTDWVVNETGSTINEVFDYYRSCTLTVVEVTNMSGAVGVAIPSSNYTVSNCRIAYAGLDGNENNTLWNVTGSWTYSSSDSVEIINDTYHAIGEVVDWFSIIIIFGAVVVLILLTVLIIRSVRSSGLGGSTMGMSKESA